MSRRTFPRAAAGLVAAALGTPSVALAQNPWRGEAALPTAPAPREVQPVPARNSGQIIIGVGFSSASGLVGRIQVQNGAAPVTPAPRVATAARPVCADPGDATRPGPATPCTTLQAVPTLTVTYHTPTTVALVGGRTQAPPAPATVTYHTGEPVVVNTLKPLVMGASAVALPTPRYLAHTAQAVTPDEAQNATDPEGATRSPLKPVVVRLAVVRPAGYSAGGYTTTGGTSPPVSYAAPITAAPFRYMPPPAPLPVPLPLPVLRAVPTAPAGDVIYPTQIEYTVPLKGVRVEWTPGSNTVPQGLESIPPTTLPVGQGRP
ncbi:MAG TPA: hypothetical protein VH092_26545 [Urbifossiella sp.]|jgi:hypothetical protein|nr:hypothetical protein [Urbifossiella sp.]